jgi:hypothetical protein
MIELESMAVEMPEVEGHPNRTGFRGVLTVVDAASQRAPAGSKGHRVVLTRKAAEAALPSLLGMALDYAPAFDGHDQRRKVGVITSAELAGRNLEVGGYLYAKDFPEIVEEIGKAGGSRTLAAVNAARMGHPAYVRSQSPHPVSAKSAETRVGQPRHPLGASLSAAVEGIRELARSLRGGSKNVQLAGRLRAEVEIPTSRKTGETWGTRRTEEVRNSRLPPPRTRKQEWGSPRMGQPLGMSFEVADVTVLDTRAHVWILTSVTFTGAAILRRDKAAYEDTWIALS